MFATRQGHDAVTLGLDVGTTNVKAVLVAWGTPPGTISATTASGTAAAPEARVLATASRPTPGTLAGLSYVVADALVACLAAAPDHRPDAVAISSMAETGAPVGPDGAALSQLVSWSDTRAAATLPELAAVVDAEDLYARTGASLGPKPPLAKWFWFARRQPELWASARWVGVADFLTHALTGRYATDHTLAGRTAAYALGAAGFDADLAALTGLTLDRLPDVLAPRETVGHVLPGALGGALPAGIPVFVAGHDHAVGAHAVGVRAPGQVADSLGTSEAIYAVVAPTLRGDRPRRRAEGMSVVATVSGDQHAVIAGSPAAGGLVAWWCQAMRPGTSPDALFADLDPSAPADAVVLPYLRGRQAPRPDPRAGLELRGLRGEHTQGTVAEALLRGLVLQARWMTEVACDGTPSQTVVLGGPTRNLAWLTRKAELSPWTTRRALDADAVALGAALIAAENLGLAPAPLSTAPVEARLDPRHADLYQAFVTAACGTLPDR